MQTFSAIALAAILFISLLLLWAPGLWAALLLEAGIFLLAIGWAVQMVMRPYRIVLSPVLIPLGGTVLWGVFQLAAGRTVYGWETGRAVLFWAAMFAACFLAVQIFSDARLRQGFLQAVLIFGAALAVVSTLQLFTSDGKVFWLFPTPHKSFVLGPFVYKNQYAAFVEMILPLAVVGAITDRRRMPVYITIAAALYASVIAATSRAGFVLTSAEIVVIAIAASVRRLAPPRRMAALAATLAACAAIFVVTAGWDNLRKKFEQGNQDAARSHFLMSSLEMVRERPWTGFGLGTWSTAYPAYARFDNGTFANEAHNDWVQWAAEGGIPFLLLMLWIGVCSVRPAMRSLWGLGVVAVLLHCLVDYPIQVQRPALAALFFTLAGAIWDRNPASLPLFSSTRRYKAKSPN
jgi:O-antigen ligase